MTYYFHSSKSPGEVNRDHCRCSMDGLSSMKKQDSSAKKMTGAAFHAG